MAAIDNLNANIATLSTNVGNLVTAINNQPAGTSETAIQSAADQVAALNNTVVTETAKLTPAA